MIGSVRKPIAEVVAALEGHQRVAVIGCNGCAKACLTGGEEQVEELAAQLTAHGKQVVLRATPERTCYVERPTRPWIRSARSSTRPRPWWCWAAAGRCRSPAR